MDASTTPGARPDPSDRDLDESLSTETSGADRGAQPPVAGKVKRTASKVAGSVSTVMKQAMEARDHVVMVRVNDEALARIMDLKDAGLFRSRSEAAAYLIAEGIQARSELFDRISERIQQIQDIKNELRSLADDSGAAADASDDD